MLAHTTEATGPVVGRGIGQDDGIGCHFSYNFDTRRFQAILIMLYGADTRLCIDFQRTTILTGFM